MGYTAEQTRATPRRPVARPLRVAASRAPVTGTTEFADRLRDLPRTLEAQHAVPDRVLLWLRAACAPLEPGRIAAAIVRACAQWVPGSGWAIFGDERVWNGVKVMIYFSGASLALELALGLAIALYFNRAFKGSELVQAIYKQKQSG